MVSVITRTPLASVVISISRAGVAVTAEGGPFNPLYPLAPGAGRRCLVKLNLMPEALVGMELSDIREALGPAAPAFRARQVYEGLYRQQVSDLVQISTLP